MGWLRTEKDHKKQSFTGPPDDNSPTYSDAKGDSNLEDRDLFALRPEAYLRFDQRSPAHRRLSQGVIRQAAVAVIQGFCKVKGYLRHKAFDCGTLDELRHIQKSQRLKHASGLRSNLFHVISWCCFRLRGRTCSWPQVPAWFLPWQSVPALLRR